MPVFYDPDAELPADVAKVGDTSEPKPDTAPDPDPSAPNVEVHVVNQEGPPADDEQ